MTKRLVLDVGNTQTVAGVYAADALVRRVRFRTDSGATEDEYAAKLSQLTGLEFNRAIVASVVPSLDPSIRGALERNGVPTLFVSSETRREFDLDLPYPSQLGADRLANVAGALTLSRGPLLIVDAGTATTFCLVDRRPAYIGGAITPGLEISWKALQSRAAKLFAVELKAPGSSLGRTTETQLQSGVLYGYASLIEGMTDRLLRDAGPDFEQAACFLTGGCASILLSGVQLSRRWRVEPDLTLTGLRRYSDLTE